MILQVDSDAAYLVAPKFRSRAGGYYLFPWQQRSHNVQRTNPHPSKNYQECHGISHGSQNNSHVYEHPINHEIQNVFERHRTSTTTDKNPHR